MKELTLKNIAQACGGELHLYNKGQEKTEATLPLTN